MMPNWSHTSEHRLGAFLCSCYHSGGDVEGPLREEGIIRVVRTRQDRYKGSKVKEHAIERSQVNQSWK